MERIKRISGKEQTDLTHNGITMKNGRSAVSPVDLFFAVLFLAAALFFILNAPYGITESDESLYQFFPYRLTNGDHLFIDDWTGTNWVAFFTYLPYRFFTGVLGGTEGLLLALRYLYVGIKLIFLAYIYIRLREYGFWAIFTGVFYVGTDLMGFKTTSYYSVCLNAVLLTGMILFIRKKTSPLLLAAVGFLFSCAVLAEPPIALIWVGYSLLVLFRHVLKKKGKTTLQDYDFVLDVSVWRHLLYGVLAAVAAFLLLCGAFFTGTDLKAIADGIRAILGFYDSTGISTLWMRLEKLRLNAEVLRPVYLILFLLVFTAAVPLHRFTRKYEKPLFALLCVLYLCLSVRMLLIKPITVEDSLGECCSHPLPLAMLAFTAYIYTMKRNRKLFAFLLLSFAVSGIVDLVSNCTFGSMLLAGSVPVVLLLRDYFREQWALFRTREEPLPPKTAAAEAKKKPRGLNGKNGKDRKIPLGNRLIKAYPVFLCVMLCAAPLYEAAHYLYMGNYHETEQCLYHSTEPLDATIETGLLKGVITTRELADNYDKSVHDAAVIRSLCQKGLIVVDYDTTVYFHSGAKVNTYAMHLTFDNWEPEELWWRLHPDRLPDVAYIPFFSLSYIDLGDITPEEKIAYFKSVADVTVTKGEIGYILQLDNWRLLEATA